MHSIALRSAKELELNEYETAYTIKETRGALWNAMVGLLAIIFPPPASIGCRSLLFDYPRFVFSQRKNVQQKLRKAKARWPYAADKNAAYFAAVLWMLYITSGLSLSIFRMQDPAFQLRWLHILQTPQHSTHLPSAIYAFVDECFSAAIPEGAAKRHRFDRILLVIKTAMFQNGIEGFSRTGISRNAAIFLSHLPGHLWFWKCTKCTLGRLRAGPPWIKILPKRPERVAIFIEPFRKYSTTNHWFYRLRANEAGREIQRIIPMLVGIVVVIVHAPDHILPSRLIKIYFALGENTNASSGKCVFNKTPVRLCLRGGIFTSLGGIRRSSHGDISATSRPSMPVEN